MILKSIVSNKKIMFIISLVGSITLISVISIMIFNTDNSIQIGSSKFDIPSNDIVKVYGADAKASYEIKDNKVAKITYIYTLSDELNRDERFQQVQKIIINVEKKHGLNLLDDYKKKALGRGIDKNNILVRCMFSIPLNGFIVELSENKSE